MTPLALLTGFLGSGKTTFLQETLKACPALNLVPHVILNDYQNAEVDAARLRDIGQIVQPISGSCVCCDSREALLDALDQLQTSPRSIILIEANGTTDSEELVEILTLDARCERFTLPLQVALIDAKRWQKRFWHNALEASQIRTASHLMLSRTDLVPEQRTLAVIQSVHKLNPRAINTNPAEFAATLNTLTSNVASLPPRNHGRIDTTDSPHQPHSHAHQHPKDHNHHHFASWEFPMLPVIDRNRLETALQNLPTEVVRAKGLCYFTDNPDKAHIFQRVEGLEEISIFPLDSQPGIRPTIILIGGNLPTLILRDTLNGILEN